MAACNRRAHRPQAVARARGRVWSVVSDAPEALDPQGRFQTSALITQPVGASVRILSDARPHEAAVAVEPTLEDAYLLALGH